MRAATRGSVACQNATDVRWMWRKQALNHFQQVDDHLMAKTVRLAIIFRVKTLSWRHLKKSRKM